MNSLCMSVTSMGPFYHTLTYVFPGKLAERFPWIPNVHCMWHLWARWNKWTNLFISCVFRRKGCLIVLTATAVQLIVYRFQFLMFSTTTSWLLISIFFYCLYLFWKNWCCSPGKVCWNVCFFHTDKTTGCLYSPTNLVLSVQQTGQEDRRIKKTLATFWSFLPECSFDSSM